MCKQQKLSEDPTSTIKKKVDMFLQEAEREGIITPNVKETLTNDFPRTPIFYLVPKVH